jgi:outer membrane usher protein
LLVGGFLLLLSAARAACAQTSVLTDLADGDRLTTASDGLLILEPRLNGGEVDAPIVVARYGASILLPITYLRRHNIVVSTAPLSLAGQDYVSSASLPLIRFRIDILAGVLELHCSAECFGEVRREAGTPIGQRLSPAEPLIIIDYDAYLQSGDRNSSGVFTTLSVSSASGTGSFSSFCSRQATVSSCGRLDASWTIDDPSTARRLVLGDSITRAARWGTPVRFAGVSWGTDFTLQPEFVTVPTPEIRGESTLESAVDIYVNDALRFQTKIPAGPFQITDIPVVTGEGTARAVITDLLGRQQTLTASFYSAPEMLRTGLETYSLEAGWLRRNYGSEDDVYDDPFFALGYARGLSNEVTVGLRSEIGSRQQSFGASTMLVNSALGQSEAALAISRGENGDGVLGRFGQAYRSPQMTIGGVVTATTPDYRIFGSSRPGSRLSSNLYFGLTDEQLGSASISWTYRDERWSKNVSAIGLNYGTSLGSASVFLTALRTMNDEASYFGALTLTIPLGGRASAGASTRYDGNRLNAGLHVREDPPASGGIGYRALVETGDLDRAEAGVSARLPFGNFSAEASTVAGEDAIRLSANGGIAVLHDAVLPAPPIGGGMALVAVGHEPGVRVYHDRQLVGLTGSDGRIVVTGLRPFEQNMLSYAPEDLPLSVKVDDTEVSLVPGLRTGHVVDFDARRVVNVLASIIDEHGGAIPLHAVVRNVDTGAIYPTGSDGLVFIPDAPMKVSLMVETGAGRCNVVVTRELRSGAGVEPVGPLICYPAPEVALR